MEDLRSLRIAFRAFIFHKKDDWIEVRAAGYLSDEDGSRYATYLSNLSLGDNVGRLPWIAIESPTILQFVPLAGLCEHAVRWHHFFCAG